MVIRVLALLTAECLTCTECRAQCHDSFGNKQPLAFPVPRFFLKLIKRMTYSEGTSVCIQGIMCLISLTLCLLKGITKQSNGFFFSHHEDSTSSLAQWCNCENAAWRVLPITHWKISKNVNSCALCPSRIPFSKSAPAHSTIITDLCYEIKHYVDTWFFTLQRQHIKLSKRSCNVEPCESN